MNPPVVVVIKATNCHYCKLLDKQWASIQTALTKVVSNLKVLHFTADLVSGIDTNLVPPDLQRYCLVSWRPIILLIPGRVWKEASHAFDNKLPAVKIIEGVQIFNGKLVNGRPIQHRPITYRVDLPEEYARWLKDSLKDPDFMTADKYEPVPVPTILAPTNNVSFAGNSILEPLSAAGSVNNKMATMHNGTCNIRLIPKHIR